MINVLALYQQKLSLFEQLEKLSATMAEFSPDQLAIDDQAAEVFVHLLDQRTVLIGQIDQIAERIGLHNQDALEGDQLEACKMALHEKIVAIQTHNTGIEATVKASLEQIREQAKKLQEGKQSNKAYGARPPTTEGSFIDKRR